MTEKTQKHDSDKAVQKKLNFPNLLPLLYHEYRSSMLNTLKNVFLDNLLVLIKAERDFVKANPGLEPLMTQDKVDTIQSILDQCNNVYEIQALSDYVLLENYVPTLEEVKSRGLRLKLLYPKLEVPLKELKRR